jgi:hypothetical protein
VAVLTKKVILRKKKGRGFDYREIEIPTDEAMIEVVRRFQGRERRARPATRRGSAAHAAASARRRAPNRSRRGGPGASRSSKHSGSAAGSGSSGGAEAKKACSSSLHTAALGRSGAPRALRLALRERFFLDEGFPDATRASCRLDIDRSTAAELNRTPSRARFRRQAIRRYAGVHDPGDRRVNDNPVDAVEARVEAFLQLRG